MQSYPPGREPGREPIAKALDLTIPGPIPPLVQMPGREPPTQQQVLRPPDVPEYYADRCDVDPSAWGVALCYMQSVPLSKGIMRQNVTVRMSWEHFKIMTLIARRVIKAHEEQALGGKRVIIPPQILQQLGLEQEAERW